MSARARVGTVGVLLAGAIAVGQLTTGGAPGPPADQQVPVTSATAVCPDVRQEGDGGATTVTAFAAGTALAAGPVAAPPATPPATLPSGPAARDLTPRAAGPLQVRGTGAGAGRLVVEQTTRASAGSRRGLAALTCPRPATSTWFVGGATVVGTFAELLLVNVEDVAALVDVQVWTRDGPADPRPGRGLSVPPRGRLVVPLDRLAPDRDLLALHVRTSRGRVAPALRVVRFDGRIPLGTDWVPPAQPPSGEVVVPGLPSGPGRRTALVTNPGPDDAVVSLELTTDDGRLVPEGLAAVPVPAGSSVAVDLSELLTGTPAALRVRSDGPPVLAGASIVDRQDGPVRELAYTASTPPLGGPTTLADVRLSPPTEVTLLLSALDTDAAVELAPLAAPDDLPAPQRVEVPAGTTVAVRLSRFLPPASTGSLTIAVRPLTGSVHAARYARERGSRGPLTALLPLSPDRDRVPRPAVVADPGAGR